MKENHFDTQMDALIRAAVSQGGEPDPELNRKLKAAVYRQSDVMAKEPAARMLSLWYLPMILNLVTFVMLAAAAYLGIQHFYLSRVTAGICIYIALAGVLLTIAGVKRTNMKEELAVCMEKRGVTA